MPFLCALLISCTQKISQLIFKITNCNTEIINFNDKNITGIVENSLRECIENFENNVKLSKWDIKERNNNYLI